MKAKSFIVPLIVFTVLLAFASGTPANDKTKEGVERVDYIHYLKPPNPGKGVKTETCYKLMGVKWNTLPVNYVINPTNSGLSESSVTSAVSAAAETWDAATSKELFNTFTTGNVQYGVYDGTNAIAFGQYGSSSNVIAVTSVWRDKRTKQIVEFDMLFNTYFTWGDAIVDPSVMDLQNIATHELGHAVGLNDLYSGTCAAETMYGYSGEGDTEKRTLEQPDKTGLVTIYGS